MRDEDRRWWPLTARTHNGGEIRLEPLLDGGHLHQLPHQEEGDERIRAAYGKNYARLVEVKRKWDPDNLFRMNKSIAPR